MQDTTVQMIQDRSDRLQYDHDRLLYERAIIFDDIDNIKAHYEHTLQERDGAIVMLRGEVSRLLGKNMKETISYNELLEDHEALRCHLDRAKKRILCLEEALAEKNVTREPISAVQVLRSISTKEAHLVEQQRLRDRLTEARKETQEVAEECDELLADNKTKYRALRSAHQKLKRKHKRMTEDLPFTPQAAGRIFTHSDAPSRKKPRANSASAREPSKLNINLKVFVLTANGIVSQHVHMHAVDPSTLSWEDYNGIKAIAWNFLQTSHSGAELCGGMDIDNIDILVRVKGFPNGRWETVNAVGLEIWWLAAKGLAAAFEQGLLGEMDILFTSGAVKGSAWIADQSMRLADAFGDGNGFAVIGES